jgi:4-hydroxybenzoyl-CoA thioesterase/acyl-CoA thioester hydrolase
MRSMNAARGASATDERNRPFVARRRVEFRDTDAAGIAHFSTFFVWMESAEHELLRHAGVPLVEVVTEPLHGAAGKDDEPPGTYSWPRVSAACDYKSAVRFNDELDIFVGLDSIGRSSVTWTFRFEQAGRWVAQGRVVAVRCLLRPGLAPAAVPIPGSVQTRLEPYRIAARAAPEE